MFLNFLKVIIFLNETLFVPLSFRECDECMHFDSNFAEVPFQIFKIAYISHRY